MHADEGQTGSASPHKSPDFVARRNADIRRLDPDVVEQIAAGEVVERPVSVVKELVENAIDAGADRIDIEVDGGGRRRILVADNGSGIAGDQLVLALTRHATSKLGRLEDLASTLTLGFRGEGLASVAAVSRLSLTSRTVEKEGLSIRCAAGCVESPRPAGCPPGTRVDVEGLFSNVPARLKFLKNEATESAHVLLFIKQVACSYPGIHFRYKQDQRLVLDYPAAKTALERIAAVMHRPGLSFFTATHAAQSATVKAYLAPPSVSTRLARSLFVFVNRRPVRNRGIVRAAVNAFGEALTPGQFPIGALFLDVNPAELDINVHPQKTEVRFAENEAVLAAVHECIAQAAAQRLWEGAEPARTYAVKTNTLREKEGEYTKRIEDATRRFWSAKPNHVSAPTAEPRRSANVRQAGTWGQRLGAAREPRVATYTSQTAAPNWQLIERGGHLFLIERRALRFTLFLADLRQTIRNDGKLTADPIDPPLVFKLPRGVVGRVGDAEAGLLRLGITLDALGSDTVVLRSWPRELASISPNAEMIATVLAERENEADVALRGFARALSDGATSPSAYEDPLEALAKRDLSIDALVTDGYLKRFGSKSGTEPAESVAIRLDVTALRSHIGADR